MARRTSILAPAIVGKSDAAEPALASQPKEAGQSAARKYHLGGYFDAEDPTVVAFRVLAATTRRSQQSLLEEAIQDLIAKHQSSRAFSGDR